MSHLLSACVCVHWQRLKNVSHDTLTRLHIAVFVQRFQASLTAVVLINDDSST